MGHADATGQSHNNAPWEAPSQRFDKLVSENPCILDRRTYSFIKYDQLCIFFCVRVDVFCVRVDVFCAHVDVFCVLVDVFCVGVDVFCVRVDVFCAHLAIMWADV